MHKVASACIVAICASITLCTFSCSQPAPPAAVVEAADAGAETTQPKPENVLRRMANYLDGLDAFSYRATLEIHFQNGVVDRRMKTKCVVRIDKPDRVASIVEEGDIGMTLVSDGERMALLLPTLNRYTLAEAPADMAAMREQTGISGVGLFGMAGAIVPASEAQCKELLDDVNGSKYLGRETIGGIECDRLRFSTTSLDWEIWIERGDRPLVHRVQPDVSKRLAPSGDGEKPAQIEYTIAYSDWNVSPRFSETDFAFTPPPGAEQVDSLMGADEGQPHPLVGQPAPAFTTVDLEGRPIDMQQHLGKKMILLDFWATWCQPCVVAMPDVDAVAEKYADRGLVFYAVNVGQDAATAKEFLAKSGLDVPVAMDPDGTIGGLYQVEGIPQTVLVGKDGKVQVVHVGYSQYLGEQLTQNIEDLLAGEDLAGDAQ